MQRLCPDGWLLSNLAGDEHVVFVFFYAIRECLLISAKAIRGYTGFWMSWAMEIWKSCERLALNSLVGLGGQGFRFQYSDRYTYLYI